MILGLKRLVTTGLEEPNETSPDELPQAARSSCDAQTQWLEPGMEDHLYAKHGLIIMSGVNAPALEKQKPLAETLLQSDADSLLSTGIPLTEFQTLVACLQPFAETSKSMPVVDQILQTLMKLRQNFVMADLA